MSKQRKLLIKNIRALMEKTGWNQSELAAKIGVAPTNMSNYLKGKNVPSVGSLETIADVFGVTIADLFKTSEVPEPRVHVEKIELPDSIRLAIKDENSKLMKEFVEKLVPILSKLQREEGVEEIIIKEVPREKLSEFINAWLRDPGLSADFYKLLDEGADDELLRNEFMREVAVGQLAAGGAVAKKARKILKETLDDKIL